jgi:hypothetical protein
MQFAFPMKSVLGAAILSASLGFSTSINAQSVNPAGDAIQPLGTCNAPGLEQSACMYRQLIAYLGVAQGLRYGWSRATGGTYHEDVSLIRSVYDGYCAFGLLKDYEKRLSTVDEIYGDAKQLNPKSFASKTFSRFNDSHNKTNPNNPDANPDDIRTWENYYIPKLTGSFIAKTPLFVLKGVSEDIVRQKVTMKRIAEGKYTGPVDDAFAGTLKSLCHHKVQVAVSDTVWNRKSGLKLLTENVLFNAAVKTDSKINKYELYGSALLQAGSDGKKLSETLLENLSQEIKKDMTRYGGAEKLKAKGMLNKIQGLIDEHKNPLTQAQNQSQSQNTIENVLNKISTLQGDGKFFPKDSPIRQYTEMFGQFKELAQDIYAKNDNSQLTEQVETPITTATPPLVSSTQTKTVIVYAPTGCPEPEKYAVLSEDDKLELPAKCLGLSPWQLRGKLCPSSEEYGLLNEEQKKSLDENCLTQEKNRKLEALKAKFLRRTIE